MYRKFHDVHGEEGHFLDEIKEEKEVKKD